VNVRATTLGNGTRIAFLERPGGDRPLLLLHGITDDARTYEPLLERIDPALHVYALDFRGHGDSSKPDARYDTDAYADDVRGFIREQVGAPVLLAGHSLGGLVTVQVGATAPELVSRLFLEDPPLYFVNGLDEIFETLFNAMVEMARTLQEGSRSREEWFQVLANAPDPYTGKPGIETMGEARIERRLNSIGRMKPQALEDALAGSLEWDTDEVLARIRAPVVMITGNPALGAVITPAESDRVTELVRGARVIHIDNVGHLVHDQQPDAWLAAVNDWAAA
jgi:pimeloyl-ACP methyl ester carboxylesterase